MKRKVVIFLLLSAVFIVGFPLFRNHVLVKRIVLTIITMNEKNPDSGGVEVWIDSLMEDKRVIANSQITITDGWEDRGRIYSAGDGYYELEIPMTYMQNGKINFLKHPYSGKVEIRIDNQTVEVIDLYSDQEQVYEYLIR